MKRSKIIIFSLALAVLFAVPVASSFAAAEGTITGNSVNLRSSASVYSSRLTYLYKGDKVTINGTSGDWYSVTYKNLNGFVHKDYVAKAPASSDPGIGLLRVGSTGSAVKQLQGNLIYLGYLKGYADGIFGSATQAAVRLYQKRNGLYVDGIAGPATQSKIGSEVMKLNGIVSEAKKHLGLPYVSGGSTPAGFDCSGFTQYVYRNGAGISIPRVSKDQALSGIAVPYSQMRVGDLVAFNSPVDHVGIYIGGGKFIHSPKPGDVVKITDLKYMNLTGIRRFTGVLANG
ncbi:MAG: Gamma-D-glutamyl-L-lysine endopeptidase [Firmicutes bacterium ADurb.Bin182]|nr:MAG: Gamma-D-glutamyl-L-lysine endopeptidase [Firmicutes bacterium ADurb.Bin182]